MSEIRGSAGNDVRLTVNSTVCNLYGAMDNEKNNRRSAFDACSEQNTAEKTRHRGVVAPQEHAENDDEKPLLLARSVRHDGSTTADNDAPKTDAEAVERIDKALSLKTIHFFADWNIMCTEISTQLDEINKLKAHVKINELSESLRSLNVESNSITVHVFGSQVYGLANKKSDVDLYLEIDGTFVCDIDRAVNLVKRFAQQLDLKPEEFKDIIKICDVRVPIIKFYHIPTNVNCDIAFSGHLCLNNTKLLKSYLTMDPTVKWLTCAITQNWAVQNDLKDTNNKFTSYALIWLVLFYLMEEKVVPTLFELMKNVPINVHRIVEGWDCTFEEWSSGIKHQGRSKLLMGFFRYYADEKKLSENVLCTFTGRCMKKDGFFAEFSKLPEINEIQRARFNTFQSMIISRFQNYQGLALQDPFILSFNLTQNIKSYNFKNFCSLCAQTLTLLENN